MPIYQFRNCLIDTRERLVSVGGRTVGFTSKTFDVLQLLIDRDGEVVTKDEILSAVWSGSFVEEGNIAVHISKIRKSLKSRSNDRIIETIHGTGYRFLPLLTLTGDFFSRSARDSNGPHASVSSGHISLVNGELIFNIEFNIKVVERKPPPEVD